MIIYQVEVSVPSELAEDWVEYMTSNHINEVVQTGLFITANLNRVLEPVVDGVTVFRVRYVCRSLQDLATYRLEHAPALIADHTLRFGDTVQATRTVSEDIWHLP